ncbi:MAG: TrkA family potassium uptake protein [Flavobacteriales bacterium]|nr:TrkA family potassium uptake protein [Flavobacteriales bacterium]
MPNKRFALIGVGRYGHQIAYKLSSQGAQVFAFDVDEGKIEDIKDSVALAIALDSTDKKALEANRIGEMDAAIIAIGENFEATVLTALNLIDLEVPRVIARASGENQIRILEKIGITEVLSPESEVAGIIAERLINPSITAFLRLPDEYEIAEIKCPRGIANRTLEDIGLRNKYGLTLITLKRAYEMKEGDDGEVETEEHIMGVVKSETVIYESDTLVVFGTIQNVKRFIDINE